MTVHIVRIKYRRAGERLPFSEQHELDTTGWDAERFEDYRQRVVDEKLPEAATPHVFVSFHEIDPHQHARNVEAADRGRRRASSA